MSSSRKLGNIVLALIFALSSVWTGTSVSTVQAAPLLSLSPQTLPFSQNWTDTGLISLADNWSGVPGIVGYKGTYASITTTAVDPQTVVTLPDSPVDHVFVNQTNTANTSGGIGEFTITNPVVAFQGSGSADAPQLLISVTTVGKTNIRVKYNLRDIDGAVDNAIQPVALQYRIGGTGNFTNVPAAFVADASTGPNLATLETPVDVVLPNAVDDQAEIQIRILTTDAVGSDEWIGIDDIAITGDGPVDNPPTVLALTPANSAVNIAPSTNINVTFSEAVTLTAPWYTLTCNGSPVAASVTGSGAAYIVNPDANLTTTDVCTFTVLAAQVVDSASQHLGEDVVSSFTVGLEPPAVTATVPANGATGVLPSANLDVTFSEAVTLTDPWFTLACGVTTFTGQVTGSGSSYTINPDGDLPAGAACTLTVLKDQVKGSNGLSLAADYVTGFTINPCGAAWTNISTIQGSSDTASSVGIKTTQGFVTALTAGSTTGFFIQSAAEEADANPLTSEGLYVFSNNSGLAVGDYIRITGMVDEATAGGYVHMTQMGTASAREVCPAGALTAPTYTDVDLTSDVTDAGYLERFESMLVNFTGTLTVQQNYFQGRFGQITLGGGGRIFGRTNGGDPTGYLRMIILDDWASSQNPNPIPYYPADGALRAGDSATGVKGVINQGAINTSNSPVAFPTVYYRVQPTTAPVFTPVNLRSETPPVVNGQYKIASFNVENYFTTLDISPYNAPYDGTNTPRGADNVLEFTRQKTKIVAGIKALNADVVGLMEIESLNSAGALADLVDTLNSSIGGAPTYTAVIDNVPDPTGPDGYDYIQVALIYKIATVVPVGAAKIDLNPIFDRVPVAQTFKAIGNGEKFSVVVNHFKSKGSCPASGADSDQGDGQGCWNARRVLQAQALLSFINTELVPVDPDVIVVGDLNSYSEEDPIDTLVAGGLVNQAAALIPFDQRYSYVFDGTSGYLDHMLSTAPVVPQAGGASFWHINSDEPSVIDYNNESFKTVDLYQPHVFRSSDHDPVVMGLNLNKAPALDNPIADQQTDEDALYSFAIPVTTFSDPNPEDGFASYTATLSDGASLPSWLTINPVTGMLSGTPTNEDVGTIDIKITAFDNGGLSVSDVFTLEVVNTNDAPLVNGSIANQVTLVSNPFSYQFADTLFSDPDSDVLTYTATQADDSALPTWLTFDAATRTFSGTPAFDDIKTIIIKVTATDTLETTSTTFTLQVNGYVIFLPDISR